MTKATLQAEPLARDEADRVRRIARVGSEADRVFGDHDKVTRWLSKPSAALGARPLDLLATDSGSREVEEELARIDWGDFA
jgi:putative toxin-antitoxin system antitoxin component (TIGR02293 family)